MLKSARLVICSSVLLGASLVALPQASFADRALVQSSVNVAAAVDGLLGFTATNHEIDTGVTTYDSSTNTYSGTFSLMGSTNQFGITTYEVICNYLSSTTYAGDCSNGWTVSAVSTNVSGGYATMNPSDPNNNFKIKSDATNALSGTSANWLMKIVPISKTVSGSTFAPTATALGYSDFNNVPATDTNVVSGNTFRTISGDSTYIGAESFKVQYGFTAGMDAVAGTYSGEVTYTLHVNTN